MTASKLLYLSAWGALFFSIIGLVWGWVSSSQMILFDGAYSLIGLGLSLLSLLTYRYLAKDNSKLFPYGKETIEPLVVIIKAIVISVLCLVGIVSSINGLLSGGREVILGHAIGYALLSTVGCYGVFFMLRRNKRSELIKAESAQWLMDTLISAAVLIGFISAMMLEKTEWAFLVPFIDPFMVLIASGYFLTVPYKLIKTNGRELLRMTPNKEIQEKITTVIRSIKTAYRMQDAILRMSKIGKTLYVEIDVVLNDKSLVFTVKEMDQVREELEQQLKDIPFEKWITVSFTQDEKWTV